MSVAVIACGAIATHISHITDSHGLDVTIYPLPPLLHNQPAKIAGEVEKTYLEIKDKHSKCAVAYADCGTYGALDAVIEKLGLKGTRVGDAMVSPKHGNYFINAGNAKSFEFAQLIAKVQKIVFDATGIILETEVRFVKKP